MGGWQLTTLSATKERKLDMDAQNFTFFFHTQILRGKKQQ